MIFLSNTKDNLLPKNLQPVACKLPANRGFTLVEIIVVISVIGILYGIVMGSISNSKAKGRDTKRIADISLIQLSLERYYDDPVNKRYPISLSELSAYDSSVSTKDSLGNNYLYVAATDSTLNTGCGASDCQYYHLGAVLELHNNVLTDDADKNSSSLPGGFNGFDNTTDTFVYDVVPKF